MIKKQTFLPPQRRKIWAARVKTGCATCRARRLKCDETKPECERCVRLNQPCPGYGDQAENRSEIVPYRQNRAGIPTTPSATAQSIDIEDARDLVLIVAKMNTSLTCESTKDPRNAARYMLRSLVHLLPSHMGLDPTLDAAVRCVAVAARQSWRQQSNPKGLPSQSDAAMSIGLHSKALISLRGALVDDEQAISPHTLLAAILICCFESFNGEDLDAVQIHMQGLAQLILHRGHARFASSFERELLLAQLPILNWFGFMYNKPCFLYEEPWLQLMVQLEQQASGQSRLFFGLQRHLAHMGAMAAEVAQFLKHGAPMGTDPYSAEEQLRKNINSAKINFMNWHTTQIQLASSNQLGRRISSSTSQSPDSNSDHDSEQGSEKSTGSNEESSQEFSFTTCQIIMLIYQRLQVAIGHPDAVNVQLRNDALAQKLEEEFSAARNTPGKRPPVQATLVDVTLQTAQEWMEFAKASPSKPRIQPGASTLFIQWFTLIGVKM